SWAKFLKPMKLSERAPNCQSVAAIASTAMAGRMKSASRSSIAGPSKAQANRLSSHRWRASPDSDCPASALIAAMRPRHRIGSRPIEHLLLQKPCDINRRKGERDGQEHAARHQPVE